MLEQGIYDSLRVHFSDEIIDELLDVESGQKLYFPNGKEP